MEAVSSSETFVNVFNITRLINPEDQRLNVHRCKNFKSCTSSHLGPNNFPRPLFSDTRNLYSLLKVKDVVIRPHKTTTKIVLQIKVYVCIIQFIVFESRCVNESSWTENHNFQNVFFYIFHHYSCCSQILKF
jgi:hypothetical protein